MTSRRKSIWMMTFFLVVSGAYPFGARRATAQLFAVDSVTAREPLFQATREACKTTSKKNLDDYWAGRYLGLPYRTSSAKFNRLVSGLAWDDFRLSIEIVRPATRAYEEFVYSDAFQMALTDCYGEDAQVKHQFTTLVIDQARTISRVSGAALELGLWIGAIEGSLWAWSKYKPKSFGKTGRHIQTFVRRGAILGFGLFFIDLLSRSTGLQDAISNCQQASGETKQDCSNQVVGTMLKPVTTNDFDAKEVGMRAIALLRENLQLQEANLQLLASELEAAKDVTARKQIEDSIRTLKRNMDLDREAIKRYEQLIS